MNMYRNLGLAVAVGAIISICGCPSRPTSSPIATPPAQVPQESPIAKLEVVDLVPQDGSTVDIMQLMAPRRLEELTAKILQFATRDQEWWQAHIKKRAPGEPLPYDSRMGLSKEEYDEFLVLYNEMSVKKVGAAYINVKRIEEKILLSFGKDVPDFGEVELDLKNDQVITKFGIANERHLIEANERQTATGPVDGIQWKLEQVREDPIQGTVIKFTLGRLRNGGRGIFSYEVRAITGVTAIQLDFIFYCDLPLKR